MPNKLLVKVSLVITAVLMLTLFASPVLAPDPGQAHLWFYSQDPATLPGPQPLPDPQIYDPNYVSTSSDPWLTEGFVVSTTSASIWLGCKQAESLGTKLVVTINTDAYNAIQTIQINGVPITSWTSGTPSALSDHGVFNTAYGYAEVLIGDLYSPPDTPYVAQIDVDITLKPAVDPGDAKVHFDAYGYTDTGMINRNPYSHDGTFNVPEVATLLLAGSSLAAFGLYAYKRKKQ